MAQANAVRAGKAFVEVVTDNTALERGLHAAQARLKAFGAVLGAIGTPMAALGGAVAGALLGAVKTFASVGDAIDEMSARTGVSAEALSELGYAAEQSGADIETLETGLRKMQKLTAEAATGSATAAEALARLGLGVQDLTSLNPEQQFKLIADRMSQIADPTQRAALAMELFGRNGTRLLPMLAGGAKGLEEFQARARALGLTISTETARNAGRLNDELSAMWRVARAGVFVVGEALAPALKEYSEKMIRAIVAATRWIKEHRELVVTALKVGVAIGGIGTALVAVSAACRTMAWTMGSVTAVMTLYRNATLGAAGATAALHAALAFLSKNPKLAIGAIATAVGAIGAAAYLSAREINELAAEVGATAETAAKTGEPEPPEPAVARGGENWARKVHQLRLQLIEDEGARTAALIRERYSYEIAEAKRANAEIGTLLTIAEAERLELAEVAADVARKTAAERERQEHELALLRIELIEDVAERERATIEENFRFASLHAAPAERAGLAALRAAELDVAAAREAARGREAAEHEALRARQAAEAAAARDADRRWEVAELELRTKYKGIELEKQLLALQEQRTLAAAEAAGENLDLVRQEFELRRRLAAAAAAVAAGPRSAVSGTFNAAVLFGLGAGGSTQERIARATERSANDLQRIRERGGMTFSG